MPGRPDVGAEPPRLLTTPEEVATFSQALAAAPAPPRALGLALLLADAPELPRERRRDHRYAKPVALALAIPGADRAGGAIRASGADRAPGVILVEKALEHPRALLDLLAPKQKPPPYVVVHGAHTALGVLQRLGLDIARIGCTLAAATLLAEGADGLRDDRELAPLVAEHLGIELPPGLHRGLLPPTLLGLGLGLGDRGDGGTATNQTLRLAQAHAEVLLPLMRALTPLLRERRLAKVFELECALVPAVVAMENAGFAVDARRLQREVDAWRKERQTATDPARISRLDKLVSTLGDWPRDYVDLDGRIRCSLHPLATDSGRFSCQNPNLQQVPAAHTAPGVRACFVAPPGHRLVIADYAQIELRVAAHIAGCRTLRQVFVDGRDVHRATAAGLTQKPESEVTDHERKLAKAINFGFLFGMGARRFREYARTSYGLELDLAAAERARNAFFSTFPGLAAWHRRVGALTAKGREEAITVHTILGRRKRFPAGAFSFTSALNIPVQGTAAEGFKRAMIDLHRVLQPLGARGILCVHDEYIAEVPEATAEEARAVIQATMEAAMASVIPSIPVVAEAHLAATWADKA